MELTEGFKKYVKGRRGLNWWDWPTVRDLARRYRCKQDDIITMVEDAEELDLIVGFRSGSGHGSFEDKGEYRVEYYYTIEELHGTS